MDKIIFIITFLLLIFSYAAYPFMARKDIAFGVRIPLDMYNDDQMKKMRTNYVLVIVVAGLLMIAYGLRPGLNVNIELPIMIFVQLFFGLAVFYFFHLKVKAIKADANWSTEHKTVVDTSFSRKVLTIKPIWYSLYALLLFVTGLVPFLKYDELPEQLVMQTNTLGEATQMLPKFQAITSLLGIQLFTMLMMIMVQYIIKKAKQDTDANQVDQSIANQVQFRQTISNLMFGLGLVVGGIFFFTMLLTIGMIPNVQMFTVLTVIVTLAYAAVIVFVSLKMGQDGSRISESSSDVITKDDDDSWKMGMFYYNSDDPSIFIGKRVGVGWTVNHARWQAWALYLAIVGFIVGAILFSK